MKRTLYAAAALFFGANLACAGTGALASLKAAGPATFSGSVSAGVDGASVESSNLGVPTVTPGAPVTSDFANFWEKLKDGTIAPGAVGPTRHIFPAIFPGSMTGRFPFWIA